MIDTAVTALIFVAGVINFAPVVGIVSAGQLSKMYGAPIEGPDLSILMRHRAALFGILGGFMIYAAFDDGLRTAALILGLLSMIAYAALALLTGGYNAQLRKVFWIDIAGIVLAAAALILMQV